MLGSIAGDIIGSVYEARNIHTTDFPLFHKDSCFTDDTVLTVALKDSLLHEVPFAKKLKEYYSLFPNAGYGKGFIRWASSSDFQPYNSRGNGSAMRVSPIGFAFDSLNIVLEEAKKSAEVTHNHPEGIKGAQAIAASIFLARTGKSKEEIQSFAESKFGYDLNKSLNQIKMKNSMDISCQATVPPAIIAFLRAKSFEDTIRKAIALGGDSDTIACMAGGIAQAYFKEIPKVIRRKVLQNLDPQLRKIVYKFNRKYNVGQFTFIDRLATVIKL